MRTKRPWLLTSLLLLPAIAFAHGEEILYAVASQLISSIVFLLLLVVVRLPYATKALLVAVFLLTTLVVWASNYGVPYPFIGAVPLGCVLLAYGLLWWQTTRP
jgi:hypothetical protein